MGRVTCFATTSTHSLLLGLLLVGSFTQAHGQELHDSVLFVQQGQRETTLAQQVVMATAILEGRLTTSRSFWDATHTTIYTAHTIQVYKVFKGTVTGPTVELLTFGGQVGSISQDYAHSPNPPLGELAPVGLLFLQPAKAASVGSRFPRNQQFQGIDAPNGAIVYDTNGNDPTGVSQWRRWHHIKQTLYGPLQALIGQPYREVAPFDINHYSQWEEHVQRTQAEAQAKKRLERTPPLKTGAKKKLYKSKGKRKP